MTKDQAIETSFYVRYAETDQMRLVHHAAYIVWFEEGRSSWLRGMGSNYADFEASGLYLAVSEVHARYLAPALYGRQVTIRTWVEEIKSRTLKFCYKVLDKESRQELVTGHTRHICIDRQGKVARIPREWRELLGAS